MISGKRRNGGVGIYGLVLVAVSFAATNVACASSASDGDDSSESVAESERAFPASEATRRELGVETWDLREGEDGGVVVGRDDRGKVRATVSVRAREIDGERWIAFESATDAESTFRFRHTGENTIETVGADALDQPAWAAAARAGADLEQASSDVLTQSVRILRVQPQTPQLVRPRPVSFTGDCLIFLGQVTTAVGGATGNDSVSAAGSALGYAGQVANCR